MDKIRENMTEDRAQSKYGGFANLIKAYGNDEAALLKDNPSLNNLYMFSNQRAGIKIGRAHV